MITPNPNIPSQIVKGIKFPQFMNTLGIIPTSYKDSMTYYECLAWLCKFLKETVIPTVNENGKAVEELQNLYVQLNGFVTSYFDNLDVQNEINNKLDMLVEDGTIDRILNQELLSNINNEISQIERNDTVFIGDSYGVVENSWIDKVANKMGLIIGTNAYKIAAGGYGFARNNQTFLQLLQTNENQITDKSKIKNFIICGGLNDINAETQSDVLNAINSFCNYVLSNYTNAHIYIGCIGWHENSNNSTIRNQVLEKVLPAYQNCSLTNKNTTYLYGVEYVMHFYGFYGVDASHPSETGQSYIAKAIYQAYKNGYTEFFSTLSEKISDVGCRIETQILANRLQVRCYGNITSNLPSTSTIGSKTINLGKPNTAYLRNVNPKSNLHCSILLYVNGVATQVTNGRITIDSNGDLILSYFQTFSGVLSAISFLDFQQDYNLLYF